MDLQATPIRSMEPPIVARLRMAFPERAFQIQRVPSVLTIDEFRRVVRLAPFIGLAWMGMTPDRDNGRQLAAAMNWRLVLIVRASSSLEARFKGDAQDIGLDAMVDVACALLQGCELTGIGVCSVTGAQAVYADGWADEATVVAQVDFAIRYQASAAELKLVTPDDFAKLAVGWLVDGSTDPEHGPDAGQEIEIPQEDNNA